MAEKEWVKEFRFVDEKNNLNVVIYGNPTIKMLDQFLEIFTQLRNREAVERREMSYDQTNK